MQGASVLAPCPIVYLRVDVSETGGRTTAELGGDFIERLVRLLPGLTRGTNSFREQQTFAHMLMSESGAPLGLLAARIAVELQQLAGSQVRLGSMMSQEGAGSQELYFEFEDERIGRAAGEFAVRVINSLRPEPADGGDPADTVDDLSAELATFRDWARQHTMLPGTVLLVREARRRNIPWIRLDHQTDNIMLGQGRWRRLVAGNLPDTNSSVGVQLALGELGPGRYLRDVNLPASRRVPVTDVDEAIRIAGDWDYPVALLAGRRGGVSQFGEALDTADDIRAAWQTGGPQSKHRILCQWAAGRRHAVLVVGNEVVAASGREAAGEASWHPDNLSACVRAAAVLGLPVAEVGFVTADPAMSWQHRPALISDVNPSPDLAWFQSRDASVNIAGAVLDTMFAGNPTGRVPVAAVTGTNGKSTTTRMLAHILSVDGRVAGYATTNGAYIGEQRIVPLDVAGRSGAWAVLRDPRTEVAVLETARGGLARHGAGIDLCDVSAVTNVTDDHLGADGIETIEGLARVKRIVPDLTRGTAVLNADDARCLAMAEATPAKRVCLVSLDPDNTAVRAHLDERGCVVVLEPDPQGGVIVLYENGRRQELMPARNIPATMNGKAVHNVQNAMFAAGMARGLGVPADVIRGALSTFANTREMSPGRLNIVQTPGGVTVVIDYAHNPESMAVTCDAVDSIDARGHRICVATTVGNRHAGHIGRAARILAGRFDRYVCGRDDTFGDHFDTSRGFPAEQLPARVAEALVEHGVAESAIEISEGFHDAVDRGLGLAQSGDLVLILTDDYEWCWDRVQES